MIKFIIADKHKIFLQFDMWFWVRVTRYAQSAKIRKLHNFAISPEKYGE